MHRIQVLSLRIPAVGYHKALREKEKLGGLTFPSAISNFFNGPEGMQCDTSVGNNGCAAFTQCHSTNFPAGYLILNLMVALNNVSLRFPPQTVAGTHTCAPNDALELL